MIKHPQTKIIRYSEKIDYYLNEIYKIKDDIDDVEFKLLVDLMEDIDSWKGCMEEIELSLKSQHIFNQLEEPEMRNDDNEIIIF